MTLQLHLLFHRKKINHHYRGTQDRVGSSGEEAALRDYGAEGVGSSWERGNAGGNSLNSDTDEEDVRAGT